MDNENSMSVIRLADVTPERVSWLWPGRIPAGKVVTLDGDPSLGKSTLALSFAAVITTAGQWPDGSRCDLSGDVVLLSAEDGLADTVRPRLDAAGADVTRVHAVQGIPLSEDGDTLLPPTLAHIEELRDVIRRVNARLLIVDVLMAYLPSGTDSHKDQDIRRVLSRLSALAENTGCTVLLLRHLNKAKGGDPLYRGGGSIGIVGAARAGMLVAADHDDDTVRVLASTKNNLGPTPPSLRYRLIGTETGVAVVDWLGEDTRDARALLAEPDGREDRTERNDAAAWLADYLMMEGPTRSAEIKKAARAEGHSKRTLERAAVEVGVEYRQEGFPRVTVWALPGGVTGATSPDAQTSGATGATGHDLQKHVGATRPKTQSRHYLRDGATTHCRACGFPMTLPADITEGIHLDCADH